VVGLMTIVVWQVVREDVGSGRGAVADFVGVVVGTVGGSYCPFLVPLLCARERGRKSLCFGFLREETYGMSCLYFGINMAAKVLAKSNFY